MSIVEIKDNYTERSVVVFGNTKPYYDHFISIKGSFNKSLKYNDNTENPDRRAGWVFSKTKLNSVKDLVSQINSGVIKPSHTDDSTGSNISANLNNVDYIDKRTFMALVSRVERLEQELNERSGNKSKNTIVYDDDDEDDEDNQENYFNNKHRFLKNKKE